MTVVRQAYALTDQSAAVVKSELNEINDSFPAQTQQEATTALNALANVKLLRQAATTTQLPGQVVVTKYATIIDNLISLIDVTGQGVSDATLAQAIRVLSLVSRMKEEASEQRADLSLALLQGSLSPNDLNALNSAISEQASNLASFNTWASVGQRQLWDNSVAPSNVFEANAEETQAITTAQESQGGSLKNDNTSVDDWYRAMSNQIDIQMGQVEQNLESQINSHVRALHARALILAWTVGLLIVLLALLFSVILRPSIRQLPAKVRPVRQSGARHRGAVERGDQRSRLSRELEDLGSEHHEGAPRRAGGPYT